MKLASDDDGMLTEINVTPLVDVMLVLLIIFMVAAPLIHEGMPINLPTSDNSQSLNLDEKDVVLSIDKNKRIQLDAYKMNLDNLRPKLEAFYANRRNKKIYIKADKGVPYGVVIDVMSAAKAAGVDQIGMLTERPE